MKKTHLRLCWQRQFFSLLGGTTMAQIQPDRAKPFPTLPRRSRTRTNPCPETRQRQERLADADGIDHQKNLTFIPSWRPRLVQSVHSKNLSSFLDKSILPSTNLEFGGPAAGISQARDHACPATGRAAKAMESDLAPPWLRVPPAISLERFFAARRSFTMIPVYFFVKLHDGF